MFLLIYSWIWIIILNAFFQSFIPNYWGVTFLGRFRFGYTFPFPRIMQLRYDPSDIMQYRREPTLFWIITQGRWRRRVTPHCSRIDHPLHDHISLVPCTRCRPNNMVLTWIWCKIHQIQLHIVRPSLWMFSCPWLEPSMIPFCDMPFRWCRDHSEISNLVDNLRLQQPHHWIKALLARFYTLDIEK